MVISLYQVKLTGRIVLGMNTIQDKRARILASGTSVMLRKGYNGTGVQEITKGAGVPKGSFYHYFESKEDFAIQALHYYYTPRIERFADARHKPNRRFVLIIAVKLCKRISHHSAQVLEIGPGPPQGVDASVPPC